MTWCYIHDRRESALGYRCCFECGHQYATKEEILDEYNETHHTTYTYQFLPSISYCPLCLHDW